MAGQKNYEMLFQLNAQVSGQYNSAFKSAQSAMVQFREEYNSVAKTQNDISAYQRQQTAVENTKEKLAMLQQQYDNIQHEIEETGSYSSALENKLLSKEQQIKKTTQALESQNTKLGQYSESLQKAGINTDDLDNESARLSKQLEELRQNYRDTGNESQSFGEKGQAAAETLEQALAAAGIAKAIKEIYQAYAACVEITGDFEEAMSNIEALSGANARELTELSQTAQELGATTRFTAQEAADAMGYMAMAGWDAQQMMSGMDGVLQLAAASGEDLATVSDIVTDNLTAFGLKASDTAHFSDVLAAAATKSNTSVSIMGETFKNCASLAGALNYSVEDVAVAVGLMANAGIKGSNAGTALKNIFSGLIDTITLTSSSFGEIEYSAINTDGTMKSFSQTLNDLRGYFAQMTSAEQLQNAETLVGVRAMSGFVQLMNSAEDDYASLTNSINSCTGAASEMAAIKLDNMNGQLTIAKSAWDALKMSIGEQFTPVLSDLYATAAKVFGGISSFLKKYPEITKAVTAISIGLTSFIAVLTAYIAITKLAIPATKQLTAALAANPFLSTAAAITAVVAALVSFCAIASSTNDEVEELSAESQEQANHIANLREEYNHVCASMGETSAEAQLLKKEIEECSAAFENSSQTYQEVQDAIAETNKAYAERKAAVAETAGQLDSEYESNMNLISQLEELTSAENQTAASKEKILAIVDLLNERIPELGLNYNMLSGKLNMTPADIIQMAQNAYNSDKNAENYETLKTDIGQRTELEQNAATAQKQVEMKQRELDAINQEIQDARAHNMSLTASELRTGKGIDIYGLQRELEATQAELDDASAKAREAQSAYDDNEAEIEELSVAIAGYTEETSDATKAQEEMAGFTATLSERMEELSLAYSDAYNAALESISGQYKLWDEAGDVSATSVSDLDAALQSQVSYWQNYDSNIATLSSYAGEIEGLSNMIASFGDGSADSVNTIAGIANALNSGDVESVRNLVTNWQAVQDEQKNVADGLADLETGYTEGMSEIQSQMAQDVAAMNMDEDAAASGKNTIQGYIDGAKDMLPAVQAAYASVGQAAIDAINAKLNYAFSWNSYQSSSTPFSSAGNSFGRGYATGTDSAKRGFAMVGENGPELVWFNGGEQVMNASETAAYQEALSVANSADPVAALPVSNHSSNKEVVIHFAPVYELSGVSNPEEIRNILAEHDANMREQLRELLAEEQEDAIRRSYNT